ncbi:hypothetical protein ACQWG3_25735, partial [Salmonella enterica subsp. enterica serovar Infantis]
GVLPKKKYGGISQCDLKIRNVWVYAKNLCRPQLVKINFKKKTKKTQTKKNSQKKKQKTTKKNNNKNKTKTHTPKHKTH